MRSIIRCVDPAHVSEGQPFVRKFPQIRGGNNRIPKQFLRLESPTNVFERRLDRFRRAANLSQLFFKIFQAVDMLNCCIDELVLAVGREAMLIPVLEDGYLLDDANARQNSFHAEPRGQKGG